VNSSTVLAVVAGLGFLLSLLGWGYQLGFFAARLTRNEQDVNDIRNKDVVDIHRKTDQMERDFKEEVRSGFDKVYAKLDNLPCRNLGWGKENCR
jgi:hypothetical protein